MNMPLESGDDKEPHLAVRSVRFGIASDSALARFAYFQSKSTELHFHPAIASASICALGQARQQSKFRIWPVMKAVVDQPQPGGEWYRETAHLRQALAFRCARIPFLLRVLRSVLAPKLQFGAHAEKLKAAERIASSLVHF